MIDTNAFNTLNILQSVYNNSLEDDETKIYQPISNIKVPLRRHQYAVIDKMIDYENKFKDGYDINNNILYSKYAILGDNVGVGKTLMVLGHIASLQKEENSIFTELHRESSKNFYSLVKKPISDLSNVCSLIIVPHTLFRQWQTEIETKTNLNLFALKTKKTVWADTFMSKVQKADVVLVSNTLYKDLYLRAEELKIYWKRLYIDEADTIELVSSYLKKEANTKFTWLISASFINLVFPHEYSLYLSNNSIQLYKQSNQLHKEFENFLAKAPSVYNSTLQIRLYIRSGKFYTDIINRVHPMRGHSVIRCSKDFIDKSITLPQLITLNILCKQSVYHSLVYDVINSEVRQLLNAGDIKSALEHLGVKTESNTNLIDAVNDHKIKELDRLQKTYDFKQSLEYSSPQIKENALKNLKEKIDHLQEQIKTFKERVENYKEDICPICYDEPNDPLITNCCTRIFCAMCILQSLSRNVSCPLCRTNIQPSSLKKLTTENTIIENSIEEEKPNEPKKKIDTFMNILKENPNGKFLVFSRYDNSFIEVISGCMKNNITTKELKGSKDVIASTLNHFKKGDIQCLLMNTIQMGAGLNITDATHVILLHSMTHEEEKQILGRAYRLGRTNELYFIRLLHPDEN